MEHFYQAMCLVSASLLLSFAQWKWKPRTASDLLMKIIVDLSAAPVPGYTATSFEEIRKHGRRIRLVNRLVFGMHIALLSTASVLVGHGIYLLTAK